MFFFSQHRILFVLVHWLSRAERMQYEMHASVFDKWRIIAPRKIWFFLAKNGRVRVRDLLASTLLDSIINYDSMTEGYLPAMDSWFSPEVCTLQPPIVRLSRNLLVYVRKVLHDLLQRAIFHPWTDDQCFLFSRIIG